MSLFTRFLITLSFAVASGCGVANSSSSTANTAASTPSPAVKNSPAAQLQTAVFAGGCFWGIEAVFEHVKGVTDVRSGYAGGDAQTANYEKVSAGTTDHAEAVKVTFDPSKVTYFHLLTVFFTVAHDPTQLNRQGPDIGKQYRSAIFYMNEDQKNLALRYVGQADQSDAPAKRIATQVVPLVEFFEAESYHQDYLKRHPNDPYIVEHDLPKLAALKAQFPDMYKED